MRVFASLAVLTAVGLGACGTEITGLSDGETMVLRVDVAGGIAVADYAFEVQDDGAIVGIQCTSLCDFRPGDTLSHLTPAQRDAVKAGVVASGLPDSGRPVNFGTECCDQFTYRVIYTSGSVVRSFTGSSEALPDPLRKLVRTLHLAYLDTPPLIVSQTEGLAGFARDAVEILDARVDAGILELDVTYGGGCAEHHLDAVAHTGWMESNPVQVGVALAHDARGDTCKALVQGRLRFDLEPLREAYAAAYGQGSATLILNIAPAAGAPSGGGRQVAFDF